MGLKVDDKAPDFTLPSTAGSKFNLYEMQKGKPTILFFYPKDFTPGCTTEACSFRDFFEEFRDLEVDVFGISTDSIPTHHDFKRKYDLPFELLSDTKGKVAKLYNAKVQFINITRRITFILDENQVITYIFNNMFSADEHVSNALRNIRQTVR